MCRKSKTKRVTRVELNRRTRRKELLRTEAEVKKIENLSKEIDRSLYLSHIHTQKHTLFLSITKHVLFFLIWNFVYCNFSAV
jgi:hypothetical protein